MTRREHLEAGHTAASTEVADRKARHSGATASDENPRGETEVAVGRLFAEMLGVSRLPRTASLFDLGLDSLSVTIACAQLEELIGVRVRFSQLFRTPTIAQLAEWIDAARDKATDGQDIAAKPDTDEAGALVAITPMQAETVPANFVVRVAWWFDGEIDDAALECAASDIHRRHEALHARYLLGPELGLAEVPADPGQAQFHQLGQVATDTAASNALYTTLGQPLRLDEGEIWRCAIVRSTQSGRPLFGLAAHHAAFDGRSLDILMAELHVAYSARAAGKSPQWPGRVASLAEMAADFRHQLAAADVDAQRRYWRDELRELPACQLPRRDDASAPEVLTTSSSRWSPAGPSTERSMVIPKSDLQVWEDYARANGMAASVSIAAAYVTAIIRAGAPRDFATLVTIANRAGEVIDRTITNRVGNILLRPNNPSRPGPHILARMQNTYHQAMAARDVLVDPKELGSVLSGENSDGAIHLDRMACMNYNTEPNLSLAGSTGTLASETGEKRIRFPVILQVLPIPEGLDMTLNVRTDLHEAGVADDIRQHFLAIVGDGPERLELETKF